MVRPVSGVPPTVPLKVVLPAVLVVRLYAPETVELNSRLPLEVLARLVSAPKVTAPV
jgi:hypothetical protein